jgi:uncharacterized protein YkwD
VRRAGSLILCAAISLAAAPDPFDPMRAEILARFNRMRQGPPLALSPALSKVAQARAEEFARSRGTARDATLTEAEAAAIREGYEPRSLSEVFITAEGNLDEALSESLRGSSPLMQEVARERNRDLGIGFALRSGEPPLYIFLFASNWTDFLKARRAEFSDLPRVRRELLQRINQERARRHLPPLRPDPKLDTAAQKHAEDMLARSYYGHTSPEGTTALERAKAAGYFAHFIGENIAEGQESYDRVVHDWMESAAHREHILSPVFNEVGSGVAVGANARGHEILWVQVFGRTT